MKKILLLNSARIVTYDLEDKNIFQVGEILNELLLILGYGEENIGKILDVDRIFNEVVDGNF